MTCGTVVRTRDLEPSPAILPVAYRAHLQRVPPRSPGRKAPPAFGCPDDILAFDTETTIDPIQRLLFGSWRYGHREANGTFTCLEEGLVYADDLPERDPVGFACLQEYVVTHGAQTQNSRRMQLLLLSRREFVNDRLWKAFDGGALVVGFNLLFDLTRLGIGCGEARGRMFSGGFAIPLFEYQTETGVWRLDSFRPWFRFKSIDSKRALMGLTRRRGARPAEREQAPDALGRFLDLRTLVFALTDKSHSLESAAVALGVADGKLAGAVHGQISPQYIDYNRQDVAVTVAVLLAALAEWDRHPVALSPDKVMSPASLAKGYLRAMGVTPPAVKFADVPPELIGVAMTAYYGGRTEVRVRRVCVPVAYLDFHSMYPTVHTLLGLWPLLIAMQLRVVPVTQEVQELGGTLTLERCFQPAFWLGLRFFAKVRPAGDILPVRAQYDPASDGTTIGVNPFWSDEPIWVAGPDLVASWLLTGGWPEILEAVRLEPVGQQEGLTPVSLRGRVTIDPAAEDFFRRVIEARAEAKGSADLPLEERERLERFLKVLANSGSYGIFAELNVTPPEGDGGDDVLVYGRNGAFPSHTSAPEDAGEYCFPPFAALTTAGARLMLAILERLVRDAGGVIAFGDTDSGAIVATPKGGLVDCPGGPHRMRNGTAAIQALTWAQVDAIRAQFRPLNPCDPPLVPDLLKLEQQNFTAEGTRQLLYAFAISAKRYALFTRSSKAAITIQVCKEHGLGHLLNPGDGDDWIGATWLALIREALGERLSLPAWADRPAVSRVSVSTPTLLRSFAALNDGKAYADTVKPTNFGLSVTVAPLAHPVGVDPTRFHLVAAYEPNPARWAAMTWYDKYSGQAFMIALGRDGPPDRVQVKSYRDALLEYRVHPEPKSLGPDGAPCDRGTIGLLTRRPVRAGSAVYIGKESNRHEDVDHGLVHEIAEVRATYRDAREDPWTVYVLPLLQQLSRGRVGRLAGVSERTVQAARNGRDASATTREAITRVVAREAHRLLHRNKTLPGIRALADRLCRAGLGPATAPSSRPQVSQLKRPRVRRKHRPRGQPKGQPKAQPKRVPKARPKARRKPARGAPRR